MSKHTEIKIHKLEESGKFLFTYSDKHNIYFIFHRENEEENKLYLITTDKSLNIENIDEIETPANFATYKNIKFFKPTGNDGDYAYIGIIIFEDCSYKFKIERYKLQLQDKLEFIDNRQFSILSCLKDVSITSYIQKRHKLYIVGTDNEFNDTIYAVVDMEKDKFESVYHLYSDLGDIVAQSINTDMEEERVYICGWINSTDDKTQTKRQTTYVEMFVLK